MPRPKVLPANRQRASEACLACRASKKRCSGTFPCPKCVRNGRAESCVPFRRSNSASIQNPSNNLRRTLNTTATFGAVSQTRTSFNVHSDVPSQSRLVKPPGKSGTPHKTHSRMLRNLQGERVYIGRAASLSFLQLLRDTVTQHIGPSQFSHNVKSEDMLETETPHEVPPSFDDDLDLDQQRAFIRAYQIATSGYINITSDPEAQQMLDGFTQSPENSGKTRFALRDIMIAIGAQSSKNDPAIRRVESWFFARAQRTAFAGMLENPSLEMVRLFTLMSFYMLGACRRNGAFMYLGVAARAAAALGLHLPDASSGEIEEQQKRTRVWMSLCTLDLLVSSILGRPPATANLNSDVTDSSSDAMQLTRNMDDSLVASYNMSRILDEIIIRLYNERAASTEVAETLLDKLKQWSSGLPESLLASPGTDQERVAAQEHIIGSLHVACAYHFAVIIVTRPFLISVLGVRLARLHQDSPSSVQAGTLLEDPAHTRLADACVESALYMIQTCVEVHQSGLLLGNMCILKALVFAAALIPGFSMFSQKEVDSTLEEAFNAALEILRVLSQQSAQAAHYFEILSLLRNAIDEQRQRLREHPLPDKKYVSKLFSLNNRTLSPRPQMNLSLATPSEADRSTELAQEEPATAYTESECNNLLFESFDTSTTFPGWEGMDLPLWDRFPFIDQTF